MNDTTPTKPPTGRDLVQAMEEANRALNAVRRLLNAGAIEALGPRQQGKAADLSDHLYCSGIEIHQVMRPAARSGS